MKRKGFTAEQAARGLATSINQGDYSLAASRLSREEPQRRAAILRALSKGQLSEEEWKVFQHYYPVGGANEQKKVTDSSQERSGAHERRHGEGD